MTPLTETARFPKVREILWNDDMEVVLYGIIHIFSTETLLNYTYRKIPLNVQIYACYEQLGAVISQNDKPIDLFSKI